MAKVFLGNKGYKLNLGNIKVKRGYIGDKVFYTGAVKVYYHIDDTLNMVYVENIEQGQSCLEPQSFNPRGLKTGYTFHGWRADNVPNETVLENLVAGETDVHIYAVYKQAITVTWYNGSTTPTTTSYFVYYNNGNNLYPKCSAADSTLITVSGFTNRLGWTNNMGTFEQIYNSGDLITFKMDTTLYSVYSSTITVYCVNGSNTGSVRVISGLISRSYADTIYNDYLKETLTHTNITNYTNNGWTDKLHNMTKKYNDGVMTFGPEWNGKYIYALYKQTFEVYKVVPSSATQSSTTTISLTRNIQYVGKPDIKYVVHPTIDLKEVAISGWNKHAWSTLSYATTETQYNDNITLTIDESLDGKTFYPLYKKSVSIYVVNGATTPSKSTKSTYRYRKFYGGSPYHYSDMSTFITLSLNKVYGYTKYGWNDGGNPDTRTLLDNEEVLVNESTEGKTFYGLYTKNVTVNWYNNTTTKSAESKLRYYKAIAGGWATKDPSFSRNVAAFSGWTIIGWTKETSYQTTALYGSGETFTTGSDLNLFAIYKKYITVTTVSRGVTNSYRQYAYYNRGLSSSPSEYYPRFTIANPSAADMVFNGWSTAAGYVGINYSTINNTIFSANTSLYAVFTWNDAVLYNNPAGLEKSVPYGFYTTNHSWDIMEIDLNKYRRVEITLSAYILVYQAQMGGSAYATIHAGTYPPTTGHSTGQYFIDLRGQSYYQSDPKEIAGLPCADGKTATVSFIASNMKADANNKCMLVLALEDYHREGKFMLYTIKATGKTVSG